jgi:hypothetical protein
MARQLVLLLLLLLLLVVTTGGAGHVPATSRLKSDDESKIIARALDAVRAGPSIGSFSNLPAQNTTIYYVSSTGDDSTAKGYSVGAPVIGPDPFHPSGRVAAFKTISAAVAATTQFQPDWILLRKGDSWEDGSGESFPIHLKTGASTLEPMLLASYGDSCDRPRLLTGNKTGIDVCCHGFSFVAFDGLEIYSHTRDPAHIGVDNLGVTPGNTGINFDGPPPQPQSPPAPEPPAVLCRDAPGYKCGLYSGVLIQNCFIHFFSVDITFTGGGYYADVVIRNNVITDAYSSSGAHSQGMFGSHLIGLHLTANVFDHNGWLELPTAHPLHKKASATIFNHNTYLSESAGVELVGNMFLRASSMGNKFRSDYFDGESAILVQDNLYVEGEIGIGIGGNVPEFNNHSAHFTNVTVLDNVLVEIGRAQPTNRTLSWGIDINDWQGGEVSHNLLINVTNPAVTNTFGLHLHDSMHDTVVAENILYNLHTKDALLCIDSDDASNVSFVGNQIQSPFFPSALGADQTMGGGHSQWSGFKFADNSYFSSAPADKWFQADNKYMASLAAWDEMVHGSGSVSTPTRYHDAARSLEAYVATHGSGRIATFEAFWTEARNAGGLVAACSNGTAFTATAVNTWLRAGFV